MLAEVTPPGVEAGQDANGRTQVFGVRQELPDGLGGAPEQEVSHQSLVAPPDGDEIVGESEYGVVVGAIQQLRFLIFQPSFRGQAVALGAAAMFAGVVVNFLNVSVGAAGYVAPHLGGPAAHDCRYGLEFMQRLWVPIFVVVEVSAEYSAYGGFHAGWGSCTEGLFPCPRGSLVYWISAPGTNLSLDSLFVYWPDQCDKLPREAGLFNIVINPNNFST